MNSTISSDLHDKYCDKRLCLLTSFETFQKFVCRYSIERLTVIILIHYKQILFVLFSLLSNTWNVVPTTRIISTYMNMSIITFTRNVISFISYSGFYACESVFSENRR